MRMKANVKLDPVNGKWVVVNPSEFDTLTIDFGDYVITVRSNGDVVWESDNDVVGLN